MERLTMENGKVIKCMAREYSSGGMESATRAALRMICAMDSACFSGVMVASTKDHGRRGNSTVSASSLIKRGRRGLENGKMEEKPSGSIEENRMSFYIKVLQIIDID
jgi:hypothetical protein